MTFFGESHCRVTGCFVQEEMQPFNVGEAGGLNVALVQVGMTALEGVSAQFLPQNSLAVSSQAFYFAPAGLVVVAGVTLAGTAAVEFAAQLAGPLALPPGACPEAAALISRLQGPVAGTQQSRAAFSLLCALAALAEPPRRGAALPELVVCALAQMHSHYGEVYGVEELASELGVSKGHLIRVFGAALGTPPGRYLTLVRIEAAKRLLLEHFALETVAGLCGFSGANYLCRVFKKEVGLSPVAWQGQHAGRAAPATVEDGEWEASLYL